MDTAAKDPELVAFGQTVREARERAGFKAVQFAREVGLSRQHYTNIEAGLTRASNAVYWRIANALELDPKPVLRDVAEGGAA